MIVFWIIAVALIAAALLFVLPPLLRRPDVTPQGIDRDRLTVAIYRGQMAELDADLRNDTITQEQYELGRQELERRLLEDVPRADGPSPDTAAAAPPARRTAAVIGVAVPVIVIGMYLYLGNPNALKPAGEQIASAERGHGQSPEQISALVQQLQERLDRSPNDAKGWAMLGRSYLVLENFPAARRAFKKAVQLNGTDPQLLVDYADSLAMDRKDQSLEGEPMDLIDRALKLNPNNKKGLWLAGTAAYERHDYRLALKYWQKLYTMVPAGTDTAKAMESNIQEVQALVASDGRAPLNNAPDSNQTAMADTGADAVIAGQVTLAADLQQKAGPNDVVYIFARAPPGGPPMPLAIIKAQVKDLPVSFKLDDSDAIMPSAKLSDFTHAVIGARISKSGDAMAHSGDLQGMSQVVTTGAKGVNVVINTVVP